MKSHSGRQSPFAVAIAGLGSRGWHHLERLSLRDDVHVAAAWDPATQLRTQAQQQGWPTCETVDALCRDSSIDGVVISCGLSERSNLVEACLFAGKHVLTEPPVALSARIAVRLYNLAEERGVCLWAASPRRWEDDVLAARFAVRSGRLGSLRALRLTNAEWAPWAQMNQPPRSEDARSTFELLAPHVLDQLGELTPADAIDVSAIPFPAEVGFLAMLHLADGAIVQFDLRRRSLAGLQTSWMLEGELAGYRAARIFTPTAEGEIVDEAIHLEPPPNDPLIAEWLSRCESGASTNERARGERLASIYERLSAALATADGTDRTTSLA